MWHSNPWDCITVTCSLGLTEESLSHGAVPVFYGEITPGSRRHYDAASSVKTLPGTPPPPPTKKYPELLILKEPGVTKSQSAYMTPIDFQDAQDKIKEEMVIWDYARVQEIKSEEFIERSL